VAMMGKISVLAGPKSRNVPKRDDHMQSIYSSFTPSAIAPDFYAIYDGTTVCTTSLVK